MESYGVSSSAPCSRCPRCSSSSSAFGLDALDVLLDELVRELGEHAVLRVRHLAVDVLDLAGHVVLLGGGFELLADELRARGLTGPRLPVDEDVRRRLSAQGGDENRRHLVYLVGPVREFVWRVRRAEDFLVLENRLAGEKVVEQPLRPLVVVENDFVEADVGVFVLVEILVRRRRCRRPVSIVRRLCCRRIGCRGRIVAFVSHSRSRGSPSFRVERVGDTGTEGARSASVPLLVSISALRCVQLNHMNRTVNRY